MRLGTLVLAGLLFALGSPVLAADIDMSKILCKDFVANRDPGETGNILVWLEGFYTREDAPPILYVDKMTKDATALGSYCAAHPDVNIIAAADKVMPVK